MRWWLLLSVARSRSVSSLQGTCPASVWRCSVAGISKFSPVAVTLCGKQVTQEMDFNFYYSATRWCQSSQFTLKTSERLYPAWRECSAGSTGILRAPLTFRVRLWRKSLEEERWSVMKLQDFPANCISKKTNRFRHWYCEIRGTASLLALVGLSSVVCFGFGVGCFVFFGFFWLALILIWGILKRTQLPLGWRNLPNCAGMVSLVKFVSQSQRCRFVGCFFSFPYNPLLMLASTFSTAYVFIF